MATCASLDTLIPFTSNCSISLWNSKSLNVMLCFHVVLKLLWSATFLWLMRTWSFLYKTRSHHITMDSSFWAFYFSRWMVWACVKVQGRCRFLIVNTVDAKLQNDIMWHSSEQTSSEVCFWKTLCVWSFLRERNIYLTKLICNNMKIHWQWYSLQVFLFKWHETEDLADYCVFGSCSSSYWFLPFYFRCFAQITNEKKSVKPH